MISCCSRVWSPDFGLAQLLRDKALPAISKRHPAAFWSGIVRRITYANCITHQSVTGILSPRVALGLPLGRAASDFAARASRGEGMKPSYRDRQKPAWREPRGSPEALTD